MTPELKVVFDLVSKLRREAHRNVFAVKLSDILNHLDDSGDSTKYGIDAKILRRILDELAEKGFVKLDYVEEVDLDDNRVDYRWKFGKDDWIYDVQSGDDILKFYGKIYMNVSQAEIKNTNDATDRCLIASLSYEDPHFIVSCNGEKYIIQALEYGAPYTILNYIMQNGLVGKPVTRKKLVEECNLKQIKDKSLKTDVFKNNSQVKALAPFIDIKAQSIVIMPSQKLTQQELKTIIEACK